MIDYTLKSRVLRDYSDLLKKEQKASKLDYAICLLNNEGVVLHALKGVEKGVLTANELFNECRSKGLLNELFECKKINCAYYHRQTRLQERVSNMLLNGSCLFLTLTFTDSVLANTNAETRRKYVRRFLKSYNCPFVANIDFGANNHREHYHALIGCDSVSCKDWVHGAINFERVRNKNIENDCKKLSKYVAKLSNHAIKETTKRNVLIYSR